MRRIALAVLIACGGNESPSIDASSTPLDAPRPPPDAGVGFSITAPSTVAIDSIVDVHCDVSGPPRTPVRCAFTTTAGTITDPNGPRMIDASGFVRFTMQLHAPAQPTTLTLTASVGTASKSVEIVAQ